MSGTGMMTGFKAVEVRESWKHHGNDKILAADSNDEVVVIGIDISHSHSHNHNHIDLDDREGPGTGTDGFEENDAGSNSGSGSGSGIGIHHPYDHHHHHHHHPHLNQNHPSQPHHSDPHQPKHMLTTSISFHSHHDGAFIMRAPEPESPASSATLPPSASQPSASPSLPSPPLAASPLTALLLHPSASTAAQYSSSSPASSSASTSSQPLLITATVDGKISLLDLRTMGRKDFGWIPGRPSSHSRVATCLAASPDFSFSTGSLYLGTASGVVIKRTRGALFGFSDQVIFNQTADSGSFFDSIFPGLQSKSLVTTTGPISNLVVREGYVVFAWKESVYVYHESRGTIVARFVKARPHEFDYDFDVTFSSKHLIIKWGANLYFCLKESGSDPFRVEKHFKSVQDICGIRVLNDQLLLLVLKKSKKPKGEKKLVAPGGNDLKKKEKIQDLIRQQHQKKGNGNREQEIVLTQNGDPLALSQDDHDAPFYLSLLSLSDFGQIGGVPLLIRSASRFLSSSQAYVRKSSDDDPLVPSTPPLTRAEKRQQKLDSHESLFFLFFTEAMVILRPLYLSEHILQLVLQKNFSLALHLCQKYKRFQSAMEVANEFACHLWEQGQHFKAIQVWAESVLPSAGPSYWRHFTYRLEKAQKLHLLEDYLPFNDRNLLSPEVYAKVLDYHLQGKNYKNFCERIHRWPVVYPLEKMIAKTKSEMKVWARGTWKDEGEGAIQYLLRSLFKLYDFQNKFTEAGQVLLVVEPSAVFDYFSAHNLWALFFSGLEGALPEPPRENEYDSLNLSERSLQVYSLAVADLSLKGVAEKQRLLNDLLALNADEVLKHLGVEHFDHPGF